MYGSPAEVRGLEWPWVAEQLVGAGAYWTMTSSSVHPHPRPVWGVWLRNVLYLSLGSPRLNADALDERAKSELADRRDLSDVLVSISMTRVGELVGRGRTSDVYAYGSDSVVKVAHAGVPHDWPTFEAELTGAVWKLGVDAPKVHDVVVINDRPSVVFERIAGPSMWQQMIANPMETRRLARELAAIQKELLQIGIPPGVPDLVDRLVRKIRLASALTADEQAEAEVLVESLPRGAALLHGDLHPGNVLMGQNGPVVIDWFDASIGHPVADVVRSSILMQPNVGAAPHHLPGATSKVLHELHQTYLAEFRPELEVAADDLARWQGVVAAGRLAEDAELDDAALMSLWGSRADKQTGLALLVS